MCNAFSKRPGLDFTSPGLDFTSPGVDFTSPGLVLPTQGLVRNSRRLVKRTSRRVLLGGRNGQITLKKLQSVLKMPFSRARIIYVFYFLKIAFTLHTVCVLLLFSSV